jgi:tRNA A22 N-methylase
MFEQIFFVDRVDHIITGLRQTFVKSFGLTEPPTHVHFLNTDIREIVFDRAPKNIVIAGVGARLINDWLYKIDLQAKHRLILSPNRNADSAREAALSYGFVLLNELVVEENNRRRHIFVFDT